MLRKVLSVAMIVALQAISCLPTLPASECEPAVVRAARHAAMHAGHDHAPHWFAPDGPRIECGCGCHASIDGLPQLLAPHAPIPLTLLAMQPLHEAPWAIILRYDKNLPKISSPPPKPLV